MRCVLASLILVGGAACGSHARTPVQTARPMASRTPPAPVAAESPRSTEERGETATHPVRWLPGFAAIATSDQRSDRGAEDRLGPPPSDCQSGDTETRTVTADLSLEPGDETVVASLGHGVVVFAADGHELARAPIGCGGSADELGALAVGHVDDIGPVIAVLATTGGRAEATTHVDLFRVTSEIDGPTRVELLFSAPIEVRDGDRIRSGRIELVPGGLVVRGPAGRTTTWSYDRGTQTLVRSRVSSGRRSG